MMVKCGSNGCFIMVDHLFLVHNIALMLNCDWFEPFECSCCRVGVLYLVILKFPQSVCFKPENIVIAGIIPGPKEPNQAAMNSYL